MRGNQRRECWLQRWPLPLAWRLLAWRISAVTTTFLFFCAAPVCRSCLSPASSGMQLKGKMRLYEGVREFVSLCLRIES